MNSPSNLYLEEKDDDDQIIADSQPHCWAQSYHHHDNINNRSSSKSSKREQQQGHRSNGQQSSSNAFICATPPAYESNMKIRHMDLFLDSLMETFLPCNSTESTLEGTIPVRSMAAVAPPQRAQPQQRRPQPPERRLPARSKRRNNKTTGKMFKLIRVRRGENIGLQLCEMAKGIYISNIAKEGTGLKRGMRVIAIDDCPCPSSVGKAVQLFSQSYQEEYVTLVTAEEHDFAAATSPTTPAATKRAVRGGGMLDDDGSMGYI
eukprot:scaffold5166_cov152-Cylindrotheca_fusiformis.AAC.2